MYIHLLLNIVYTLESQPCFSAGKGEGEEQEEEEDTLRFVDFLVLFPSLRDNVINRKCRRSGEKLKSFVCTGRPERQSTHATSYTKPPNKDNRCAHSSGK